MKKLIEKLKEMLKPDKPFELVKCKDCAWSDNSIPGIDDIYCRKHLNWVEKEGFCSHGVKGDKK